MSNIKKIIPLLALFLISSVILVFKFNIFHMKNRGTQSNIQENNQKIKIDKICTGTDDGAGCLKEDVYKKAISDPKTIDCETYGVDLRSECLKYQGVTQAPSQENPGICLKVNSHPARLACTNQYYFNQAIKKNDQDLCKKISLKNDVDLCLKYLIKPAVK